MIAPAENILVDFFDRALTNQFHVFVFLQLHFLDLYKSDASHKTQENPIPSIIHQITPHHTTDLDSYVTVRRKRKSQRGMKRLTHRYKFCQENKQLIKFSFLDSTQ